MVFRTPDWVENINSEYRRDVLTTDPANAYQAIADLFNREYGYSTGKGFPKSDKFFEKMDYGVLTGEDMKEKGFKFVENMQIGDSLEYIRSPQSSWHMMCGRAGIFIFRDGKAIDGETTTFS